MKTIFEKTNGVDGVCIGETEGIKLEGVIPKELLREGSIGLPQLSELEVLRHYKELSDRNFCIEKGFYPLGSCTMKYNPKVNELLASLEEFANLLKSILKPKAKQTGQRLLFRTLLTGQILPVRRCAGSRL